jgi:hypothetical protein
MLKKIAQVAHELDKLGLHEEADILTDVLGRIANVNTTNQRSSSKELEELDFGDNVETLHYETRAEFNDAVEKYIDDPRLIDIGYFDKIIKLEKSPQREAQAKSNKPLNKPFRTPDGPKKFSVYVKDGDKVKKVNFGDPTTDIKRDNPERRKNFRARHNCDNPGPKTKARYWSCRMWEAGKTVGDMTGK